MIFQNENVESMLNAIDLLGDKELLQTMKRNTRQEAEQFSWDKASQHFLDFYYEAINNTIPVRDSNY